MRAAGRRARLRPGSSSGVARQPPATWRSRRTRQRSPGSAKGTKTRPRPRAPCRRRRRRGLDQDLGADGGRLRAALAHGVRRHEPQEAAALAGREVDHEHELARSAALRPSSTQLPAGSSSGAISPHRPAGRASRARPPRGAAAVRVAARLTSSQISVAVPPTMTMPPTTTDRLEHERMSLSAIAAPPPSRPGPIELAPGRGRRASGSTCSWPAGCRGLVALAAAGPGARRPPAARASRLIDEPGPGQTRRALRARRAARRGRATRPPRGAGAARSCSRTST